jgi:hypothetical protein
MRISAGRPAASTPGREGAARKAARLSSGTACGEASANSSASSSGRPAR